jgi:hypothetical protein
MVAKMRCAVELLQAATQADATAIVGRVSEQKPPCSFIPSSIAEAKVKPL